MRGLAWVFGLGFMAVGCGGAIESAPKSPSSNGPQSYPQQPGFAADAPASAARPPSPSMARESAVGGASAESAPSSAPKSDSPAEPRTARRERPGLGTEWGESRSSRIREVAFERENNDPLGVVALNYNDREGARALAGFREGATASGFLGVTALGGAVRVSIQDENGNSLPTVRSGDRTIVVGQEGQRYSIVLTNRTGRRFETVASVDGLDVISGRTASYDQRGYVLLPFATLRIDGFRQSERAVAAFRFSRVSESYAAQTGTARNVGVIGIAFFRERGDFGVSEQELELRDSASPFPNEPNRFAQPPRR